MEAWKRAGTLSHEDIGKGIWCRLRYKPEIEWPWDATNTDGRYEWGWARITMVTHSLRAGTKVRIHGGGLVDWGYGPDELVHITGEEYPA